MKFFTSRNKNNLKPLWAFSQKGNLWRFFFAGSNTIIGETRDIDSKLVYFFSLDSKTGKPYIKNHRFENENYWLSIEGLNDKYFFLHSFERPDLPQHKSIIALDNFTGETLWENNEYLYLFCTNDSLYAYKEKFEEKEIVELDIVTGEIVKTFEQEEHDKIYDLRYKTYDESAYEKYNYPKPYNIENIPDALNQIFNKEFNKTDTSKKLEYISKDDYLMFNYYLEKAADIKSTNKKSYENRFCIYKTSNAEKIYQDTLNKNSLYNVPDNFFLKDDNLYYLKEKKELIAINLKQ